MNTLQTYRCQEYAAMYVSTSRSRSAPHIYMSKKKAKGFTEKFMFTYKALHFHTPQDRFSDIAKRTSNLT